MDRDPLAYNLLGGHRFGLTRRTWSSGYHPDGMIAGSHEDHPGFGRFGTVRYPDMLSPEDWEWYGLVPLDAPYLEVARPDAILLARIYFWGNQNIGYRSIIFDPDWQPCGGLHAYEPIHTYPSALTCCFITLAKLVTRAAGHPDPHARHGQPAPVQVL